jgi:hypothetical protein
MERMKNHVNLIPTNYRRRRLIRRRLWQWCVIWSAVALGCWGAAWAKQVGYQNVASTLSQRRAAYEPVKLLNKRTREIRENIHELNQRETMVDQLRDLRPPLVGLGIVSRCAKACDGRVQIQSMTIDRKRKAAPTSVGMLILNGRGINNASVAQFVAALRVTKAFDRIELKSSVRRGPAGREVQQFLVHCEY